MTFWHHGSDVNVAPLHRAFDSTKRAEVAASLSIDAVLSPHCGLSVHLLLCETEPNDFLDYGFINHTGHDGSESLATRLENASLFLMWFFRAGPTLAQTHTRARIHPRKIAKITVPSHVGDSRCHWWKEGKAEWGWIDSIDPRGDWLCRLLRGGRVRSADEGCHGSTRTRDANRTL